MAAILGGILASYAGIFLQCYANSILHSVNFFLLWGGNVNVAVMGGSMLNPNGSLDRNGGIILIIRVVS